MYARVNRMADPLWKWRAWVKEIFHKKGVPLPATVRFPKGSLMMEENSRSNFIHKFILSFTMIAQ